MGVGKTTVCQLLKQKLNNAVFLDGDWCWDADPFRVTDETKSMVLENITMLLNNFIRCSAYENVIFCWVMHEQSIIDAITDKLPKNGVRVITVSLVCNEETLKKRLFRDVELGIRQADVISRSTERLPLYDKLNTVKIVTDGKAPEEIAEEIAEL